MPEPMGLLHVLPTIVGGSGFEYGRRSVQITAGHGAETHAQRRFEASPGSLPVGEACSSGHRPRVITQRRRRSAQQTGGGTCVSQEAERAEAFLKPLAHHREPPMATGGACSAPQKPGGGACSFAVGCPKSALRQEAEPAAASPAGGRTCRASGATRRDSALNPRFRTPYPFPI